VMKTQREKTFSTKIWSGKRQIFLLHIFKFPIIQVITLQTSF